MNRFFFASIVLILFIRLSWQGYNKYQDSSISIPKVIAQTNNSQVSKLWQVKRIIDGDTIVVIRNGEELKVRFCGIDAPETQKYDTPGQPFGIESKSHLKNLIQQANNQVSLQVIDRDRYDRPVAEIYANINGKQVSLNRLQLESGMTYLYKRYYKTCPNSQSYVASQAKAQNQKMGVWSQPNLEKPWDFRHKFSN